MKRKENILYGVACFFCGIIVGIICSPNQIIVNHGKCQVIKNNGNENTLIIIDEKKVVPD